MLARVRTLSSLVSERDTKRDGKRQGEREREKEREEKKSFRFFNATTKKQKKESPRKGF
jgi:hypothetical protein